MDKVHSATCGSHQFRPKPPMQAKRLGYYGVCRNVYANILGCSKEPPKTLHATTHLYPSTALDIDAIGPFEKAVTLYKYMLVVTDYFSKQTEVVPICDLITATVSDITLISII